MKWLLLAVVIFLVASGRGKLSELFSTAKKLPKDFEAGKKHVEDPVGSARDVTPSKDSEPRS